MKTRYRRPGRTPWTPHDPAEIDYEIPSLEEAVRRITRRYVMTGMIDVDEIRDLRAAYSSTERNLTMAHKELAPGQTSPLIRAMQYALNANGVACPTTGTWDDATTGALEAFQDGEALPVEPRCSRECWAALGPLH